ncbi:MAG: hypothetical protein NTZ59_05085 [Bacteroidetes bacterium]|nr:hypothetical protein [Bacteroidota bacterium]
MKRILTLTTVVTLLVACGNKGTLAEKKAKLEKLKTEIKTLETEIAKLDTSKKEDVSKLIGVTTIVTADFKHYIDLQGKVDAENISYISPRLGGGQVKQIFISKY